MLKPKKEATLLEQTVDGLKLIQSSCSNQKCMLRDQCSGNNSTEQERIETMLLGLACLLQESNLTDKERDIGWMLFEKNLRRYYSKDLR